MTMPDEILHYGTPHHSGRYPWGSGDDPQQRNKSFLGYVDDLKKKGVSDVDICKGLGITTQQLRSRKSIAKAELRKADVAQAIKLRDKGYSNVAAGKRMGINESSFRALLDKAIQERSTITESTANMLKENVEKKGYIDVGVGTERHIGISRTKLKTSIEMLKAEGYIISYNQVEQLGTGKKTSVMVLSKPEKAQTRAIFKLKNSGYSDSDIAKELNISELKVALSMKEAYSKAYKNTDNIKTISDHSEDGGRSFLGLEPIRSVNSNRVHIRYREEGGSDKDGVIELRKGIEELSLGKSKYAQVRIGVDGTHYMKGMAMYSDDVPKGADIIYNTNKPKGTDPKKVFKEMKDDPDNPFGAVVRQQHHITEDGKKNPNSSDMLELKRNGLSYDQIAKKMNLSETLIKSCIGVKALNIVNEEGEWQEKWSKSLSSQMLSKQTPSLAKKQLDLTYAGKKEEFDEIVALNNPVVKKRLLDSFADDCDSAAVHLKAAALPREGWHVILPFPGMKENEVFAPNYDNGERVVLIRYPHGGIFEIPELVVNNRYAPAKNSIGQAKDAVGINHKVAERLSGADFDGDTVLVIPNPPSVGIKTKSSLKGLKDFDPKISYKPYDGMRTIDGGTYNEKTGKVDYGGKRPITRTMQLKMGDVSNLITDMTIRGANDDDIAAAVRHSMVIIDSSKHSLNHVQSYKDNGIAKLKERYQGSTRSGASTLISRASSETSVGFRKLKTNTKKMTPEELDRYNSGEKVYSYTDETYTNKKGKAVSRKTASKKMAEVSDAFTLSSGTRMETVYATHANSLKALANSARKESLSTKPIAYDPSAKKAYAPEVASLTAHLNIALKNAPLERQAQILANTVVSAKRAANPDIDSSDIKKIKGQALAEARTRVGAKKQRIEISEREWAAIQSGAISTNTLTQILSNTDLNRVKQLATPRTSTSLTKAKQAKAELMLAAGYTQAEIASHLGVSASTISNLIQ